VFGFAKVRFSLGPESRTAKQWASSSAITRHFGIAAEQLSVSQPALSQSIRALEEGLGVVLLDRRSRRVKLTAAGEIFLPEAQAVLAQAARAVQAARRAGRGEAGVVEIAYVGSAPFSPVFARIFGSFREANPGITLHLTQMPSLLQLDRIAQAGLDFGFIRAPVGELVPGLIARVLTREALLLALPAGHALARAEPCALAALADQKFIQYQPQANTGLHAQVAALCRQAGFEPAIAQIVPQVATMLCLVRAGLGVAIVPESMRALGLDGLSYRALTEPEAVTELHLVGRYPEPSAAAAGFFRHALRSAE
jgi:DNA-binding transcriptional LysR family regulator